MEVLHRERHTETHRDTDTERERDTDTHTRRSMPARWKFQLKTAATTPSIVALDFINRAGWLMCDHHAPWPRPRSCINKPITSYNTRSRSESHTKRRHVFSDKSESACPSFQSLLFVNPKTQGNISPPLNAFLSVDKARCVS